MQKGRTRCFGACVIVWLALTVGSSSTSCSTSNAGDDGGAQQQPDGSSTWDGNGGLDGSPDGGKAPPQDGSPGNDASADGGDGARDSGAGKLDHLVIILMENHNLTDIYGTATYMTQLADQNALLQNYSAVDHPSEPNYLAIASGQTFDPTSTDDLYHVFMAQNIVDRLESAGKTWRAYTESASGPCDTSNPDVRHVPFIFFDDVVNNATRCARIIPTTAGTDAEMIAELNAAGASNFIWLTPNDTNNMHDGTIAQGDAYLQALVPQILGSMTFMTTNAALLIVFDEGNQTAPDIVYSVWAGPVIKKMLKSSTSYTHYSILATLEAIWGFKSLTMNDSAATPMMEVFQ